MDDPFFTGFNWDALQERQVAAPFDASRENALDTDNFDEYEEDTDVPEYYGEQTYFENF